MEKKNVVEKIVEIGNQMMWLGIHVNRGDWTLASQRLGVSDDGGLSVAYLVDSLEDEMPESSYGMLNWLITQIQDDVIDEADSVKFDVYAEKMMAVIKEEVIPEVL